MTNAENQNPGANAEEHSVSPVGFGELLAGCTSAGGEFGSAGSMDWCTV